MSDKITVINRTQQPLLCAVNLNSSGTGQQYAGNVINPGVTSGLIVSGSNVYSLVYCANNPNGFSSNGGSVIPNLAPNSMVTIALITDEKPA